MPGNNSSHYDVLLQNLEIWETIIRLMQRVQLEEQLQRDYTNRSNREEEEEEKEEEYE